MNKLLNIFIVSLVAFIVTYGAVRYDFSSFRLPWSKEDPIADAMELLGNVDPYVHSVLSDHLEEARPILEDGLRTKDSIGARTRIIALVEARGHPVIMRADDQHLLELTQKTNDLLKDMAAWMPGACRGYATGNIPVEVAKYTGIKDTYLALSKAKHAAYENGRSRRGDAVVNLSEDEIARIVTEFLNFTQDDANIFASLEKATDDEICEGLLKLYNVEEIPDIDRMKYIRSALMAN